MSVDGYRTVSLPLCITPLSSLPMPFNFPAGSSRKTLVPKSPNSSPGWQSECFISSTSDVFLGQCLLQSEGRPIILSDETILPSVRLRWSDCKCGWIGMGDGPSRKEYD